jgi:hypothetical protein
MDCSQDRLSLGVAMRKRLLLLISVGCALVARPAYVANYHTAFPTLPAANCQTCHTSASGGSRNAYGKLIEAQRNNGLSIAAALTMVGPPGGITPPIPPVPPVPPVPPPGTLGTLLRHESHYAVHPEHALSRDKAFGFAYCKGCHGADLKGTASSTIHGDRMFVSADTFRGPKVSVTDELGVVYTSGGHTTVLVKGTVLACALCHSDRSVRGFVSGKRDD